MWCGKWQTKQKKIKKNMSEFWIAATPFVGAYYGGKMAYESNPDDNQAVKVLKSVGGGLGGLIGGAIASPVAVLAGVGYGLTSLFWGVTNPMKEARYSFCFKKKQKLFFQSVFLFFI